MSPHLDVKIGDRLRIVDIGGPDGNASHWRLSSAAVRGLHERILNDPGRDVE
ncbi:hypothetical protein [Burkholderia ubonensis]|uniref:hypothetical protein n=1 Tax=Burkholderia ubonensis TaxID=101571 RepID=UPI001E3F8460|nr:hypothetical protein [Burkholderia ubonensis]